MTTHVVVELFELECLRQAMQLPTLTVLRLVILATLEPCNACSNCICAANATAYTVHTPQYHTYCKLQSQLPHSPPPPQNACQAPCCRDGGVAA